LLKTAFHTFNFVSDFYDIWIQNTTGIRIQFYMNMSDVYKSKLSKYYFNFS
jgi:hypothetical protein